MKIVHLDKEMVCKNITNLIEIDKIIPDEPWTVDNFLMDLDHKWEFSLAALEKGKIIGFLICSIKGNNLHIHRIAVLPENQKKKIGYILMKNLFDNCYDSFLENITLKVKESNLYSLRFYEKLGFEKVGIEDYRYLCKKKIK